jgi:hypothetical protein
MIINNLPYTITGTRLHLPTWNRAPVGLATGSKAKILKKINPNHHGWEEYTISPYPNVYWPDMWRFEILSRDARRQLADIIEEFDRLDIHVLSSESRIAFDDEWSMKHFMISCQDYVSSDDGNTADREARPKNTLDGLKDYFMAKYMKALRFTGDLSPRVSVERNWPHYEIYNASLEKDQDGKQKYQLKEIEIDESGMFEIPFESSVEQGPSGHRYRRVYVSTNVRSKMIYATTHSESDTGYTSIVVYFDGNRKLLAKILGFIGGTRETDLNYNVIRHQLRMGLIGNQRLRDFERLRGVDQIFSLNLMIDDGCIRGVDSKRALFEEIERRFYKHHQDDPVLIEEAPVKRFQ